MLSNKHIQNKRSKHSEMEMAEKSMDKDRDDQYLTGQSCVTKPIKGKSPSMKELTSQSLGEEGFNEAGADGFNNIDRHSADYSGLNNESQLKKIKKKYAADEFTPHQVPDPNDQGITPRRSNSSANTTSHSAPSSSAAMSKDTKKL